MLTNTNTTAELLIITTFRDKLEKFSSFSNQVLQTPKGFFLPFASFVKVARTLPTALEYDTSFLLKKDMKKKMKLYPKSLSYLKLSINVPK